MNTRLQILAIAAAASLTMQAQTPGPAKPEPAPSTTMRGVLIDAACRDFSQFNLSQPAQAMPAPAKDANAKPGGGASASGITVDAATLDAERADAMPHQVADLVSRQSDPTCAIKGDTHAYALLLPDGRVTDLDEGGNTFADAAVKADPRGRAMLAGQGPGFKPVVTVTGRVQGSKIVASAVKIAAK